MTVYRYCTPEWLKQSAIIYRTTPRLRKELEKVTTQVFYRIKAEPAWGIDRDILFGAAVNKGELEELAFFSEEAARAKAKYIMAATPQEWKKILRKENKFLTDFMLGRITLEQGSKIGVLGLAPYANVFVDALTQVDLQFPDELTTREMEEYRTYVKQFRAELEV